MSDDIKSMVEIIRACDSVHLATFGLNGYPDVRHITNVMNRGVIDLMELYFLTGVSTQKYSQLHSAVGERRTPLSMAMPFSENTNGAYFIFSPRFPFKVAICDLEHDF